MRSGRWGRGILLAVVTTGALVVPSGADAATPEVRVVKVRITPAGCVVPERLAAGPVLFEVTAAPGTGETELEVIRQGGNRDASELYLSEGETGDVAVDLLPGRYRAQCPGSERDSSILTVTGPRPRALPKRQAKAVATYVQYQLAQCQDLRVKLRELHDAIAAGDVEQAKAAYEQARVAWAAVQPTADAYGTLADRIDADASGFGPIAKGLWSAGSTDGLQPVVDQLLVDVDQLYEALPVLTPTPTQAVGLTARAVRSAAGTVGTTGAEPASQLGLVEIAAAVKGAHGADLAFTPLLGGDDASKRAAKAAFAKVDQLLADHVDGVSYAPIAGLSAAEQQALRQALGRLSASLTAIGGALS